MPPIPSSVALAIKSWAVQQPWVRQVVAFGSRVKGTNSDKSDLDIAVSLVFEDPDECLAYWFAHKQQWLAELQNSVPWKVDLQFFDHKVQGVVTKAMREASHVVFSRS